MPIIKSEALRYIIFFRIMSLNSFQLGRNDCDDYYEDKTREIFQKLFLLLPYTQVFFKERSEKKVELQELVLSTYILSNAVLKLSFNEVKSAAEIISLIHTAGQYIIFIVNALVYFPEEIYHYVLPCF